MQQRSSGAVPALHTGHYCSPNWLGQPHVPSSLHSCEQLTPPYSQDVSIPYVRSHLHPHQGVTEGSCCCPLPPLLLTPASLAFSHAAPAFQTPNQERQVGEEQIQPLYSIASNHILESHPTFRLISGATSFKVSVFSPSKKNVVTLHF